MTVDIGMIFCLQGFSDAINDAWTRTGRVAKHEAACGSWRDSSGFCQLIGSDAEEGRCLLDRAAIGESPEGFAFHYLRFSAMANSSAILMPEAAHALPLD